MKTLLLLLAAAGTMVFAQNVQLGGRLSDQPAMNLSAVITGNPLSAQAVTETVQTLTDGNRITRSTSSPVYRDSQGRQRREIATAISALGQLDQIIITDPVAGVNWTLNPAAHIAFRTERLAAGLPSVPPSPLPTSPAGGSIGVMFRQQAGSNGVVLGGVVPGGPAASAGLQTNDVVVAINGQAIKDGADLTMRVSGIAPGNPVQVTFERQGKSSTVTMTTVPRRIVFDAPGATNQPSLTPEELATLNTGRMSGKAENLGTMNIEGLPARGTRTTVRYAAGEIGNERPLSVVNEVWYSVDLQAILISKHSDPRSGDVTYRLTEIKRSEPPASVFEVPAEYTVRQPIR